MKRIATLATVFILGLTLALALELPAASHTIAMTLLIFALVLLPLSLVPRYLKNGDNDVPPTTMLVDALLILAAVAAIVFIVAGG